MATKAPHRFAICAERLSTGGDHMEFRRTAHDISSNWRNGPLPIQFGL
jgi:hypothetical protein